jgi:hypothetical protein
MSRNPKLLTGAALWLLSMIGVLILAFTVLPQILVKSGQHIAPAVAISASIIQSGILLLVAVWAGLKFSAPVGLGAPAIEAAVAGSEPWAPLRRQVVPAVIVGLVTGAVLLLAQLLAPAELLAAGQTMEIPLAAKVFYGGVAEEVLLRWGVLTVLIWLPWRFAQKSYGRPQTSYVVGAIVVAALLFGAGHLPTAAAILGEKLTTQVATYIIVGNSLPGILFGYLYWRYGIEAAIIAHALAHIVFVAVMGM